MKKFILSATLLFLSSNFALAESPIANSKNFAGPAIAIGLSSVGSNSKLHFHKTGEESDYSVGNNQFIAVVNASYLKDISDKWLIGGGITYDLHSLKNGEAGYNSVYTGNYKADIKSESHYSAYIQPTYALNSSTALFLKASYHETKVNIKDGGIFYIVNDYTRTLHGFGLGFGAMIFLNDNIFTKIEMEYVDYSQERIAYNSSSIGYKLSTTSGILSIGYRF